MSSDNSESTELQSSAIAANQQTQSQQDEENLPQNPIGSSSSSLSEQRPCQKQDKFGEIQMNMALLDPPRWGWTALGGIADVLSPHERSRRHSTCRTYKAKKRTRKQRKNGIISGSTKLALTASALLKDPPSYSIAAKVIANEATNPEPIVSEDKHPSTCSKSESTDALTSQSISENPLPQTADKKESDPKTKNDTNETTIPKTIPNSEEGNNSTMTSGEKEQRKESEAKTEIAPDSDTQTAKTKRLDKSCDTHAAASQATIDIGMETVGISTSLLGLTIEQRQQQQNTEANNDDAHDEKKEGNPVGRRSKKYKSKSKRSVSAVVSRTKYDCHVRSLEISTPVDGKTEMILDMYAYHQGREGMEARDAETGELLFEQQVTDTNHDFDAPKSTFQVEIEFPLEDEDNEDCFERIESNRKYFGEDNHKNTITTKSSRKNDLAMYRETLMWDLLDPNTPTPIAYASAIGKEYGLSFGQTMDLATRIDKQIQKHINETSHYREAIATREPIQELTQPRKLGPVCQPHRYDEVVRKEEGGTFRPKRERHSKARSLAAGGGGAVALKKNRAGKIPAPETVTKPSISEKRDKSKKNTPAAYEVNLEDELDDDLLEEVKRRTTAEPIAVSGILKAEPNAICHICKKRMPKGYHFACSASNHVYCDLHVQKRLGITMQNGKYRYDSCPICTLTCECAKCVRKLKNVATLLKAKSIEQMKQPHEVDYPDIFSACTNMISSKALTEATDLVLEKKRKQIRQKRAEAERLKQEQNNDFAGDDKTRDKKSRTILLVGQTMVPRPPLSDFPRELHNGIDFDAKATGPYFTVYSAEGKRSVSDVPGIWLDDENRTKSVPPSSQLIRNDDEVPEDGNVDYCHICRTAGHLILCDFCPRGFHHDCLKNENRSSADGDHWECYVCKNEKIQSESDYVDGRKSMDAISAAFLELDANDERAVVGLEVLSIIHQMLKNLEDYDFGYTFSEPVDTSLVPGYTDIVKHPMDFGTICKKLENGEFAKLLNESFSMDDLVTKVLKDIELIWRNCIMFNVIGSSVARMAFVLRRRVKMISQRSIFSKLSNVVKKNVTTYAQKFDEAWASGITASLSDEIDSSVTADSWRLSAIENMKPRSNLQFAAKPTSGRPIAIFDSVSGRIVKLYSSPRSASKAVEIILKAGHRCEWNATASRTDLNCKLIAERSRNDPNSLLFGYRWLFLDDLEGGNVTFFKAICDFVEMRHDNCSFVFRSIEEALSSTRLSKAVNINDLRTKLTYLPRNGDWTEIEGMKWRRPLMAEKRRNSFKDSMTSMEQEDVEMGANLVSDSDSLPSWKHCSFLKKDLVTDQILVGFDSIQVAQQDWMQSALSSPSFPSSEAQTMENFKKYYLDGDRNIDGMIWQTVENGQKMELVEKTIEATNKENLADMEIEDNGSGENQKLESTEQSQSIFQSTNGETKYKSSMNESLSSSVSNIAPIDDRQRAAFENQSATETPKESLVVTGKRKSLNDDEINSPSNKEARLSIVFVE